MKIKRDNVKRYHGSTYDVEIFIRIGGHLFICMNFSNRVTISCHYKGCTRVMNK
jgi:hypothetical protein